jgi:putative transposase
MKASKLCEGRIVWILKEAETGAKVAETCRKPGISGADVFRNHQRSHRSFEPTHAHDLRHGIILPHLRVTRKNEEASDFIEKSSTVSCGKLCQYQQQMANNSMNP